MKNLMALIEALHKGKQLANPAVWKNSAILVSLLGGFLGSAAALAKEMGYDTGLTQADWAAIAGSVALIYNAVVHVTTSRTVGLPSPRKPDPETVERSDPAGLDVPGG